MPVYTSPFTGTVVTPTDVSYYPLAFSSNQTLAWPASVNGTEVPAARIIDCVASSVGLTITLPPANQGTTGADILIRNLGGFPFTVLDAAGGESLVVSVGISKYLYLTNNTTLGGVWANVTFAAGTSYADATTLAGAGLTSINGKLTTTQNIIDVAVSPTISDSSRAATYVWNSGAGSMTLPDVAMLTTGWYIGFRNNGTGTLTITPTSPNLINGLAQIQTNPGDSGFIMYDASTGQYITIGWVSPSNIVFTSATYDVDAVVGNSLNLVSFAPIIQTYIAQSGTRSQNLNVTLPAITQIYMLVNNTNQLGYNITFQNQGSSQPPVLLPAGNTIILLSDGNNLFPLTQTSIGLFYAANGSAAVPSYSFNNDSHTGLYLQNTSILGISANGVQMIKVDNSNLTSPTVTVNATLNASLITGGTF